MRRCLLGLVLLIIGLSWSWAEGSDFSSATDGRFYEPVEAPGKFCPALLGKKNDALRVYAWRDFTWQPVLYQIEERTPEGKWVFTQGPEANPQAGNGLFDKQDLIVFMARDGGEAAPEKQLPSGAETAVKVECRDPESNRRAFFYVTYFPKNAPVFTLEPVAALEEHQGEFTYRLSTYGYKGVTNHVGKKASPTIYIDKLWILSKAGGNEKNIIDRQKVRGVLSFVNGIFKVRFNENLVSGGITAYHAGPVRILTHSCMYPQLPMKIKGPKFYIDSILVDTLTLTTTKLNVPFDPGFLIHEMVLGMGMDYTPAAKGMKCYSSSNRAGFLIDGRMDNAEKNAGRTKDEWRLVTGPQGTQITITRFDPNLTKFGSVSTIYNDNEQQPAPPENVPGEIGASYDQLAVKSLAAGTYRIEVFGCIPIDFFHPQKLNMEYFESILRILKAPLVIQVGENKMTNRGGSPRMLDEM